MRRLLKIAAWTLGVLVLLAGLLVGGVMVAGNTPAGRVAIERLTDRLTDGVVKLYGLGGTFPTQLTLERLELVDSGGIWLSANEISLHWAPLELLFNRVHVDTLHVTRLHMERTPISSGHGGAVSIPDIEVDQFAGDTVELGAPLVGTAATLSLAGHVRLRSLEDANTDVVAHRVGGEGDYTLHLHFDPKRMDASLTLHEPASGPLENLLSLPGLGALSATATLKGPRNAELIDVAMTAGGLHAAVQGSVDLTHESAEVAYELTAPALAPRPDVAWTRLALKGNWHGTLAAPSADGRLTVDALRIADTTRIAKLTADLTGSAGKLAAHAVLDGLEIPGPQPRLLAKSPLVIDASLPLNEAGSGPLAISASHVLLSVRGSADTRAATGGERAFTAVVKLPDLRPFAELADEDVRGTAVLTAKLIHSPMLDKLSLDSNFALGGGKAPWLAYVGPRVAVQLAANVNDQEVTVDAVHVAAGGTNFAASGRAARAAPNVGTRDARNALDRFIANVDARGELTIADLAALSSDVAGTLKVSARVSGSPHSLLATADIASRLSVRGSPSGEVDATLRADGLPSSPSGSLRAHGTLDGAPLTVDATLDRGIHRTLRLIMRDAEWKTAHLEGDVTADSQLSQSHGQLALRIEQLSDFDRLLGTSLSGSVTGNLGFVPASGRTEARLQLDAKDLVVNKIGGNLHLQALGNADALHLDLKADLPELYGAPLSFVSAGVLDIDSRELQLASASLAYRGATVRLLDPARLKFAEGLTVEAVKFGAGDAVAEIEGELSPEFDLRASLRQVKPELINVFSPGLLASGSIEADARLKGSAASPTGRLRLDATGIRFADGAATGLPPVDVQARARLADGAASINASLTAGAGSKLTASGSTPLDPNGALDLRIGGTLDVGLVNPLLEARGMRATGALTVDATVTGSAAAPSVGGGITLAKGSLRDYGHGVNLTDISADIVGDAGGLKIKSFEARAATGNVTATGTLGILEPLWPMDITITAKNAQPVASTIVTANLDAEVHVKGTLRERLDVAGKIDVHHATVGIPNSLPPDVAVLDVRRRGKAAAPAAQKHLMIGVDLTINAPQQVLVQGRGLDAEMGGQIKLAGTTDALVASGGLNLLRGSFSISGTKLNFTQDSKITFDGTGLQKKIDPTLDFTASTTVGDTTANLAITGPADAPRFNFTSSPSLPPDQIMSLLLFNTQNPSSLSALQVAQIGAALASLSGVGGNGFNPLTKLQKSLGLDRLNVGANTINTVTGPESSGAAIEAGRYISKRVYVEGRQSTTGNSQVQVDVDLTKHLKLQTRLGNGTAVTQGTTPENDPGSSIGLSYQFEY
jgi:translocation and assembly module TamB